MKPWLCLVFFTSAFLIWHAEAEFFTSIGMETTNAQCYDTTDVTAKTVQALQMNHMTVLVWPYQTPASPGRATL